MKFWYFFCRFLDGLFFSENILSVSENSPNRSHFVTLIDVDFSSGNTLFQTFVWITNRFYKRTDFIFVDFRVIFGTMENIYQLR